MGHRANFISIRQGTVRAYYDQWAGLGCAHLFSAGPEEVESQIAEFESVTELLDWAFAEGGILLDHDEKVAIAFGEPADLSDFLDEAEEAQPLPEDPLLAAFERGSEAFLDYVSKFWPGWTLTWDERGVDAFADYMEARGLAGLKFEPASAPPDISAPLTRRPTPD